MPIIVSEPQEQRGKKDAARHREKQREAIKKNLPEILSHEGLITRKGKKTIKVPIRSIDIPHFRPAKSGSSHGVGQGPGRPGKIIGQKPMKGQRPGKGPGAGDQPGEDYIEAEVDIDYIIELMMEDLGLPNLDEKQMKLIEVEMGWKFSGTSHTGARPLLKKRPTVKEAMKRFYAAIVAIKNETGADDVTAYNALKQTQNIVLEAVAIIRENRLDRGDRWEENVRPYPLFSTDTMRFHDMDKNIIKRSRVVVIAMMDVSGSMGEFKKYMARASLFWFVEFLRKQYQQVEIRFIVHHTEAKLVDEYSFFHIGESGGTIISSAYILSADLIETEYPPDSWDVYCVHFSDGDNYVSDNDRTVKEVARLLFDLKINMFAYAQISDEGSLRASGSMLQIFRDQLKLEEDKSSGIYTIVGDIGVPFVGVALHEKEDIIKALGVILKKTRWKP